MSAPDRSTAPEQTHAGSGVRRRGQRVVVRAGDASSPRQDWSPVPPEVDEDRRRPIPTLTGLGDETWAAAAEQPDSDRSTLPDFTIDFDASGEDLVMPPSPRATLRDGVDDALASSYRQQAERIVASGALYQPTLDASPIDETPPPPAAMMALGRRLG